MRRIAIAWAAAVATVAATAGACQAAAPTPDPATLCAAYDMAAIRASVRALPGWSATTHATIEKLGQVQFEETQRVLFRAPDLMVVEFLVDGSLIPSEWYLGDRWWTSPDGPLPEKGTRRAGLDQQRAELMPPRAGDLAGPFRPSNGDGRGTCVAVSEDGSRQISATAGGLYVGEHSASPLTDGSTGNVTVEFEPTVPTLPTPPPD